MGSQRTVRSRLFLYIDNLLAYVGKTMISLLKPFLVILYRPGVEMIGLEGLHGWLIVVGIVVILWPLYDGLAVFVAFSPLFSTGTWKEFITPGSVAYAPSLGITLLGSLILNIALICASLYLTYLFFSKKKAFQKWSVGIAIAALLFKLADLVVSNLFIPGVWVSGVTAWEMCSTMLKWFLACAIWVSYMLLSKRVKATFVK